MRRTSKTLPWILFPLVLTIWGIIAFNIAESITVEEDSESNATASPRFNPKISIQKYSYLRDVRDPFQYVAHRRKDTSKKTASSKSLWTPPPFKLTGILSGGNHHTAMIEGPGGAVWFLKEKDTLSGMKILKISEQAVTYYYQKKKNDWVLERP